MPASVWLLEMCYLNFMVPLKPFSTYWELNPHARLKPSQHPVWDLNSLWLGLSQFSSVTQSCLTLCIPMDCSMPGLPVHHQVPELTPTHVHWVSYAIQSSHPLSSLLLLPPIPPSIRIFSNESALCKRWPKYWSFSFSFSPSNEHPGLISFRTDWLDLFALRIS